jgi:RNA polymerase sigma-70 factor (ECF subfamily)
MQMQQSTSAIWFRLSDDLRRFIRRRVGDDHVADDLLQETFVRIHRGISSIANQERLAPWVYRIARNVVNDHYRKSAHQAMELVDADPPYDAHDDRPHLPGCAQEWMAELIQQLPATYREAVRLADLEGLTQQQVADRLGLSLSGAKSRIQRGRVLLKGILEQCCRLDFDRRGNLQNCEPRSDRSVCLDCDL